MVSEALAKLRADVFSRVETCALEIRDQRFNVCVGLLDYLQLQQSPQSLENSILRGLSKVTAFHKLSDTRTFERYPVAPALAAEHYDSSIVEIDRLIGSLGRGCRLV